MARRILSSAQRHLTAARVPRPPQSPPPLRPLKPLRPIRSLRPLRQFRRRTRLSAAALILAIVALAYGGWRLRDEEGRKPTYGRAPTGAARHALRDVMVVLDPGHGGADSGALDDGLREDELNYRLTSTVAAALRERGATVTYTVRSDALLNDLRPEQSEPPLLRPSDATLVFDGAPVRLRPDRDPTDLYRRAAFAAGIWRNLSLRQRGSGRSVYFLALHCDKLSGGAGRGARVYFDSRGARGVPPRLAVVLKRRLTDAGLTNSGSGAPIPRHYGVLNPRYNPVPESVLLEMLTMSNAADRRAAVDPVWRWRFARLVADAVAECENETPRRFSLTP